MMQTHIEQLRGLAVKIPAGERHIAQIGQAIDECRANMKEIEAAITLEGLDGKNEKERAAQLALKLRESEGYQDAAEMLHNREVELTEARQDLSESTHLWRVLDLAAQLEIADRLVMAGVRA